MRCDADDVNPCGQYALEVHKHFGPIEAAREDDTIQNLRAGIEAGVFVQLEEVLEVTTLLLQFDHLLADLLGTIAQLSIRPAAFIDVPAEAQEKDAGDESNASRQHQELAVGDQRPGCQIQANFHSLGCPKTFLKQLALTAMQ